MSHNSTSTGSGPTRARRAFAAGGSIESSAITVYEAVESLARHLLAQGWSVRMPRTAWDCEDGSLSVSSRAFSSTAAVVYLDARRRITLILPSGEEQQATDVGDLTRMLRCAAADCAARSVERVPA